MKKNWKTLALEVTAGSKFGAILRCALGLNSDETVPRFVGQATITSDGYVMASFIDPRGGMHFGAFVGDAEDYNANVLGLAEYLALDSDERRELYEIAKKWIAVDYRPAGMIR